MGSVFICVCLVVLIFKNNIFLSLGHGCVGKNKTSEQNHDLLTFKITNSQISCFTKIAAE